MERELQAKIGQILVVAGALVFLGGGGCVFAGLLTLESLPPGITGIALLMEIAGLGLTEKNRD